MNCSQITLCKYRFFNSVQFCVQFKCNWCKWLASGKARFAKHFNRGGNMNCYQTTLCKCRFFN
jgi:hypothetical protein